ncbi:hypothetical protein JHD48_07805 [Sulfurimonas sp. SAG-AH-194-I05]|nr:hypothetical protein [Sulfurimonas sp. SAG-AH-194-I05]MDF1875635.1 hypothetical protein [Sulfurimonas sp. SAG-AH-194-I05]
MFEHINTGVLIMGIVSSVMIVFAMILRSGKAAHENKEIGPPYILMLMLAISMGMIVYDGLSSQEKFLSTVKGFKENKTLRCSTLGNTYLVSKSKGWSEHKDGYSKGDLFFRVKYCGVEAE